MHGIEFFTHIFWALKLMASNPQESYIIHYFSVAGIHNPGKKRSPRNTENNRWNDVHDYLFAWLFILVYAFSQIHSIITLLITKKRERDRTVADNISGNQGEYEKMNNVQRERHLGNDQDHSASQNFRFLFLVLW